VSLDGAPHGSRHLLNSFRLSRWLRRASLGCRQSRRVVLVFAWPARPARARVSWPAMELSPLSYPQAPRRPSGPTRLSAFCPEHGRPHTLVACTPARYGQGGARVSTTTLPQIADNWAFRTEGDAGRDRIFRISNRAAICINFATESLGSCARASRFFARLGDHGSEECSLAGFGSARICRQTSVARRCKRRSAHSLSS